MMINSDQAVDALRQANPAFDERQLPEHAWTASALLDDTARRMAMKTQNAELTKLEPRQPRSPKRLLVAAAAFVIALAVVGIGALVLSNVERSDPVAGAQAGVDEAFAAHNSGDMETWAQWREYGTTTDTDPFAYESAAGGRLDVEGCTYRGFQEWTSLDVPLTGHGFDCEVTYTDSLLETGGIELQMTYNWIIGTDPESSVGSSNEDPGVVVEFFEEFSDWLSVHHPEAAAAIRYQSFGLPSPESVPIAAEYIDEFVAQSDTYPLIEPVPEAFPNPLS